MLNNLIFTNPRIIFKNFSGELVEENQPKVKRCFSIIMDDTDLAERLIQEGWSIRTFVKDKSKDADKKTYHLKIFLNYQYKGQLPEIMVDGGKGIMRCLGESEIDILDLVEFKIPKIIVRAHVIDIPPTAPYVIGYLRRCEIPGLYIKKEVKK